MQIQSRMAQSQLVAKSQGKLPRHLKGAFHCLLTVGIYQAASGRGEHTAGQKEVPVNTLFVEGSPDFAEFLFQAV